MSSELKRRLIHVGGLYYKSLGNSRPFSSAVGGGITGILK